MCENDNYYFDVKKIIHLFAYNLLQPVATLLLGLLWGKL